MDIYDVHGGCLDRVSFGCLNVGVACHVVRGFPSIAPCLEHVCAGGGGEGSVAFEGFVLYAGGVYALSPNVLLRVQVWPTRRLARFAADKVRH